MASLEDAARELATTRKVLAAVPVDKGDYRPDPVSMTALDLVWHIASAEWFFLDGVTNGKFSEGDGKRPEQLKTVADVVAWYDQTVPASIEKAKSLTAEQCTTVISFHNVISLPAVAYLGLMVKHSVHHRGQLSAYLRPMGAKVPAIYGGSADEPMGM